jgi:hypothetical protein
MPTVVAFRRDGDGATVRPHRALDRVEDIVAGARLQYRLTAWLSRRLDAGPVAGRPSHQAPGHDGDPSDG